MQYVEIASASNKSATIEYVLQNREIDRKLNARQVFAKLKECIYNNTSKEKPWPCSREAPNEINVFTDGSLLHNKKHFVSIEELVFGGPKDISTIVGKKMGPTRNT